MAATQLNTVEVEEGVSSATRSDSCTQREGHKGPEAFDDDVSLVEVVGLGLPSGRGGGSQSGGGMRRRSTIGRTVDKMEAEMAGLTAQVEEANSEVRRRYAEAYSRMSSLRAYIKENRNVHTDKKQMFERAFTELKELGECFLKRNALRADIDVRMVEYLREMREKASPSQTEKKEMAVQTEVQERTKEAAPQGLEEAVAVRPVPSKRKERTPPERSRKKRREVVLPAEPGTGEVTTVVEQANAGELVERPWVKVVRRRGGRCTNAGERAERNPSPADVQRRIRSGEQAPRDDRDGAAKRKRTSVEAVEVTAPGTYDEILCQVRTKVDINATGSVASRIRETRAGKLLIEMPRGVEAERMRVAVSEALGEGATVRRLVPRDRIELLDLDGYTTAKEVCEAVAAILQTKPQENEVRIRRSYARTQVATLTLPTDHATKLVAARKIKVGWVMARVRIRNPEVPRCYRCLGFGHTSAACQGGDRSGACLSCGETGHRAAACKGERPCILCTELKESNTAHRPGSAMCAALKRAKQERGMDG